MSNILKIKCPDCGNIFDAGSAFNDHVEKTRKEEKIKAERTAQLNAEKKFKSDNEKLEKENLKLKKDKEKDEEKIRKEEREKASKDAEKRFKSDNEKLEKENLKLKKDKEKDEEKIRKEEREKASKDAEEKFNKINEKTTKENQINNKRLLDRLAKSEQNNRELQKIINQKSTEVQGEVQEELIEDFLRRKFPSDSVTPIKKGEKGGDCIMTLHNKKNDEIGKIYFESKDREKVFQEKWVDKLLKDMQERNIGYGILVSVSKPKDLKKDDGYVTRHNCIIIIEMNYRLIHSVVCFVKDNLETQSQNSKDFDGTAEMKRLWELIKSDQFKQGLRVLYLKMLKIEKNIEKQKKFFEKNIADQELSLLEMNQELKNIVLSFRSKVGTILPDNLLDKPEDK